MLAVIMHERGEKENDTELLLLLYARFTLVSRVDYLSQAQALRGLSYAESYT